jgi:hypothetical protein
MRVVKPMRSSWKQAQPRQDCSSPDLMTAVPPPSAMLPGSNQPSVEADFVQGTIPLVTLEREVPLVAM